jgi:hypothetical protein
MNTADNLPNIIQTFPTNKDQLPDSTVYKAKINHYSPIVCSRDPQTIGAVLYEALIAHFAKVWEELYLAKKNNGELKQIKITWWESSGAHHAVDAEFYLENWRANYSTLAENWREISSTPNAIR